MTDFPTLLYTSTSELGILSYSWDLKKVPLLGGASPLSHYREYLPSPCSSPGLGLDSKCHKNIEDHTKNNVSNLYSSFLPYIIDVWDQKVQTFVFYEAFLLITWITLRAGVTKYSICVRSCVVRDITVFPTVWMVCLWFVIRNAKVGEATYHWPFRSCVENWGEFQI